MIMQNPGEQPFKMPPTTGVKHFFNAFKYSMQGLAAALKYEAAFRQELFFLVLMVPAAFLIGEDLLEVALMLVVLFNVLAIELLNSGIENIVNKTIPEFDELAGRAKDMGSAAVFIALAMVVLVWTLMVVKNFL
jgi:diacylglycerol kinase (ATP)